MQSNQPFSPLNENLTTSPSPMGLNPALSHIKYSSLSTVPFSWERQPGIPKVPDTAGTLNPLLLPLPPPLRSAVCFSRNNKSGDFDPFAVALAQCVKESSPESGEDIEGLWWRRSGVKRRAAIADRIGLISFYGSCKATCSVSDATIVLPRAAGRRAGLYGQMNRRRV